MAEVEPFNRPYLSNSCPAARNQYFYIVSALEESGFTGESHGRNLELERLFQVVMKQPFYHRSLTGIKMITPIRVRKADLWFGRPFYDPIYYKPVQSTSREWYKQSSRERHILAQFRINTLRKWLTPLCSS